MNTARLLAEGRLRENVPIRDLTTYKLGGPARYFLDAATLDDLRQLCPVDGPVLVVGRGSNLVVADRGFAGLVVRLGGAFGSVTVSPSGVVEAGAAAPLPTVARTAVRAGRAGLEWMVGVPGSVGGAVRMNAGCHGSDTATALIEATILDLGTGAQRGAGPGDLDMRYRHTNLTPADLVVAARFRTSAGDRRSGEAEMRAITRWRRTHQPGGTFNAGSVFKNPPGDAAGRIIDALGLKSFRVGGVAVSEKHANFFVATADATAQDVWDLVRAVRRRVREETGVDLEPEITFAGFEEAP